MNSKGKIREFLVNVVASGVLCHRRIRNAIYRGYGVKLSRGCEIKPRCYMGNGSGVLRIGEGTSVNYNCWFDLGSDIIIGSKCNIAMNVMFLNSTHKVGNSTRRAGEYAPLPIVIGDGCWIGANSTIMPGVTIVSDGTLWEAQTAR